MIKSNNYRFCKNERLNSEKLIDHLFKNGSSFTSNCIRMIYILSDEAKHSKCQVLFSVPKRNFKKAVDRNLIRRRMKEAYRLSKNLIIEHSQKKVTIAFIYLNKDIIDYHDINLNMVNVLKKLEKRILKDQEDKIGDL